MTGGNACARRIGMLLRYVMCRPAAGVAWLMVSVTFVVFASLTSASVRLMLTTDGGPDGLAMLSAMGPSIAGAVMAMVEPVVVIAAFLSSRVLTNSAMATPLLLIEPRRARLLALLQVATALSAGLTSLAGSLVATGLSRLILAGEVPQQSWPAPLSVSLWLCVPVTLLVVGQSLIALSLAVATGSTGKGAVAYVLMYYVLPIAVTNIPVLKGCLEWLPSTAGRAIFEPNPTVNVWASGIVATAYAALAILAAHMSLSRRDVG